MEEVTACAPFAGALGELTRLYRAGQRDEMVFGVGEPDFVGLMGLLIETSSQICECDLCRDRGRDSEIGLMCGNGVRLQLDDSRFLVAW